MVKDNQDSYKRGGRSGGPGGTRKQHRSKLSQEKAELRRASREGATRAALTATEEAEAQLQSLGRDERHGRWRSNQQAFEGSAFAREIREEEAPFGFGIPASEDAALGHEREPFERERGEMLHAARDQDRERAERRLSPTQRRLVRTFPPVFRAVGDAARAIEKPIRNALETLQLLGRSARRTS
ncbi:hypothetical protein [Vulgatibacter sp.]|uniref:hypothetical protein n=1 Tax=Vulgatibacter sp. TaxID=1971226 RepID=UPI003564133E